MTNSYLDLVQQTFNFPQEGFEVKDGYLQFNGVDVKALIDKYGTPLKLSYLPKIGNQIRKAKQMFAVAFKKHKYEGKYFSASTFIIPVAGLKCALKKPE